MEMSANSSQLKRRQHRREVDVKLCAQRKKLENRRSNTGWRLSNRDGDSDRTRFTHHGPQRFSPHLYLLMAFSISVFRT